MKKRLNCPKQDKITLGITRNDDGDVIHNISQVEFEPSEYYIEAGRIYKYTEEELMFLDK